MSSIVDKVGRCLLERLALHPKDGSTIEQAMTDCAVIVLSNMRAEEIDSALFMSLGVDGVTDLITKQLLPKPAKVI
jgi:hypothetical protein